MSKVIVGMSGGVDSAVAALLLKNAGHEVIGVTLRTWLSDTGEEGRCCEMEDARRICEKLNIRYYPLNCRELFDEKVIKPFIDAYLDGLTPNPCIECNRYIKWERMLYYADIMEADFIATGHYSTIVRLPNGRYSVKKARYSAKDQTYMLYKLSQEQLSRTLMPLGDFSKEEVRDMAAAKGLGVENKPDSQELCFVIDGDYADYIKTHTDRKIPGTGAFIDKDGRLRGEHKGFIHYTIGQRKGLGIAAEAPLYVIDKDIEKNVVYLGAEEDLYADTLIADEVNWMSVEKLDRPKAVRAKTRYRQPEQKATVYPLPDGRIKVIFNEPQRAITVGQAVVMYDEDVVVGGGRIVEVIGSAAKPEV